MVCALNLVTAIGKLFTLHVAQTELIWYDLIGFLSIYKHWVGVLGISFLYGTGIVLLL